MSVDQQAGYVMLGVVLTLLTLLAFELTSSIVKRTRGKLPADCDAADGAVEWERDNPVTAALLRARGVRPGELTPHMRDGAVDGHTHLLANPPMPIGDVSGGGFRRPLGTVGDNPVACTSCGSLVALDLSGVHRERCKPVRA